MRKCLVLALAAAWCFHAGDASAHSHKQKGLEIVHPWCFATGDAAAKTAAVYMLIKNRTKRSDRLIGATSPSAQSVELRGPAASSAGSTWPTLRPVGLGGAARTLRFVPDDADLQARRQDRDRGGGGGGSGACEAVADEMPFNCLPSLRGAQATKQSRSTLPRWIASPSARNDGEGVTAPARSPGSRSRRGGFSPLFAPSRTRAPRSAARARARRRTPRPAPRA
jgi:hypothetical protein